MTTADRADGIVAVKTFGWRPLPPVAYSLDLSIMDKVPVRLNGNETNLADAYRKVRDSKLRDVPEWPHLGPEKFETESGDFALDCDGSLIATVCSLFKLEKQGINPFQVTWYYYGHDSSRHASEVQMFFAVHDGKIILETQHFSRDEPMILQPNSDEDPIWQSRQYFDEALDRYRYHQFYSETMTGRLMALRSDQPTLYYYERPQARAARSELEFVALARIYHSLWVVLPLLAASAYPPMREIMVLAALGMFLDFVRVCWATRKVGDT